MKNTVKLKLIKFLSKFSNKLVDNSNSDLFVLLLRKRSDRHLYLKINHCLFCNFEIPIFRIKENKKMLVNGIKYQSIWVDENDNTLIKAINQSLLPFRFEITELRSVDDTFSAIRDMTVRGAPLIGAAGAFGMYLATLEITSLTNIREHLSNAARYLISCRPTAVNLTWAVNRVLDKLINYSGAGGPQKVALDAAREICDIEKENCRKIGENGLEIIESLNARKKGNPVNILTHCNAGWLATVDFGTAIAPVYLAHRKGIRVHVWVDETRPRNQGARLTAWELGMEGVPCTLIPDNTGGHLMQKGMVDLVVVGCDRATRKGDVANKIGTYQKAVVASDNNIPFYVATPTTSIDLSLSDGLTEIPVEEREAEEVTKVEGYADGKITAVRICPDNTKAGNWGFDITPARLITGFITEKGNCSANEEEIKKLFSEKQG
jgi:methylthioribose-1-phosphate isomerase